MVIISTAKWKEYGNILDKRLGFWITEKVKNHCFKGCGATGKIDVVTIRMSFTFLLFPPLQFTYLHGVTQRHMVVGRKTHRVWTVNVAIPKA